MSEAVHTGITIGGKASPEVAHKLRALLADHFGGSNVIDTLYASGLRDGGNADQVEDYCQRHNLPYVLIWAGNAGSIEAGSHAWRPGLGQVVSGADAISPISTLDKLKLALKIGRTVSDIVDELQIGNPGTLPHFVEAVSASPESSRAA